MNVCLSKGSDTIQTTLELWMTGDSKKHIMIPEEDTGNIEANISNHLQRPSIQKIETVKMMCEQYYIEGL
jgi:hypothetical protein